MMECCQNPTLETRVITSYKTYVQAADLWLKVSSQKIADSSTSTSNEAN